MPKAIYEGIYREIRSRIINGTYAFQEMLPTEAELTAEFGCTRNTVRRALSMLADQMFVQPIHGKGCALFGSRVKPHAGRTRGSRVVWRICKAQQCRCIDGR